MMKVCLSLSVLFDLILYVLVNNLSVMSGWVFLGCTSTKQGLICLVKGHNPVTPVRLEPVALRSQGKHSTTEPLRSFKLECMNSFKILFWKKLGWFIVGLSHIAIYCNMWQAYCNNTTVYCAKMSRYIWVKIKRILT